MLRPIFGAGGNYVNYKYNQKELQETGLYDYGWRQYMPDIARWNGTDPLAEAYSSFSPYAYVANNPVSSFDVDGRWFNEDGSIFSSAGDSAPGRYNSSLGSPPPPYMGANGQGGGGEGQGMKVGDSDLYTNLMAALSSGGDFSYSDGMMNWWIGVASVSTNRVYNEGDIELASEGNLGVGYSARISQSNYNFHPYKSESYNVFSNINYDAIKKITDWKNFSIGLQTQYMEYAVRHNYKSANSWLEFNKLRKTQQEWRTINTLGKEGAQALKVLKVVGNVATIATTAYTVGTTINYYRKGGDDWQVGAKAGLDLVMTGVGFLGPIGFSISATYFVVDAATGGFGGFGAIPQN